MKFRNWPVIITALLAVILLMSSIVSAQSEDPDEYETETEEVNEYLKPDEETLLSWPFSEDIDEGRDTYISRLIPDGWALYETEDGVVTFVSGDESGEMITNEEEALTFAMNYLMEDAGDLLELRSDTFGDITVYTFQQRYYNEMIYGSYMKIITNSYGEVVGIISTLTEDPEEVGWDYYAFHEPANWEERFAGWGSETYEKTVTAVSEEVVNVSIPVLIDPNTGERYLGDKDRLIFCVDLADIENLDDRGDSTPINMDRNLYSDGELLTYYRFIQVYDYFAQNGWWGPDGQRTPCLLQFDTSGEFHGNASYASFQDGFHIFNFSIDDGAGQSLQVIAHEFTHGVSATNHIGNYANETGALDEALSDMIGNAVEADIRQWEVSENPWLLSFRRAHLYENALYVWDEFYTPSTDHPDEWNDLGDVHHSSSLISILTWRMYEAGMTPRDVFDYWFTFDLVLSPKTDFSETAAKAGWCAEIAGLSDYAPVMQQAVEDLRLTDKSLPNYVRDHLGMIVFENPLDESNVKAVFIDPLHDSDFTTWPIKGTDTIAVVFGEGTFWAVSVQAADGDSTAVWNAAENRWEMTDPEKLSEIREAYDSAYCIRIEGGTITELGD